MEFWILDSRFPIDFVTSVEECPNCGRVLQLWESAPALDSTREQSFPPRTRGLVGQASLPVMSGTMPDPPEYDFLDSKERSAFISVTKSAYICGPFLVSEGSADY